MPPLTIAVDAALWFLLPRHRRTARFDVTVGGSDTVGHIVIALGIPLTEVGTLTLDGERVAAARRGAPGVLAVRPVTRPQRTTSSLPRFVLDVHLGSLTRRLRLVGLDAAYDNDAEDAALVRRAAAEGRVLLTRDRALLYRGALPEGALVRGSRTDDQLDDVLDRFAPPLAPWTRCVRCNALLAPTTAAEVAGELEPGTRRTYRTFSRCTGCGRVYWRGAHAGSLEAVVERAQQVVARHENNGRLP